MKKNKYILAIAIILTIFAVILIISKSNTTLRGEDNDFAIKDTSNVTMIFLADMKERTVTLKRTAENKWKVNDKYIAVSTNINLLLEALHDIKVKIPVSKAAHNNVVTRIASTGIKVEIYQEVYRINIFNFIKLFPYEKRTKTYYVGGPTQNNIGTFMLIENSTTPFITHIQGFIGFLTPRYSTKEKDWRSHVAFRYKISEIKSIELQIPESPELSYRITRNDREFTITTLQTGSNVENFDTLKVVKTMASFNDVRFEAILDGFKKEKLDSLKSSTPYRILTISDVNGNKKELVTYRKKVPEGSVDFEGNPIEYDLDRFYGLINNSEEIVLIQYFIFNNILKPLDYFLKDSNVDE